MDPGLDENELRRTGAELERGKVGEQEKEDREWLDHYSRSRNPMEGPFGGLANMVKTRPGVIVFIVFSVLLFVLLMFLSPN